MSKDKSGGIFSLSVLGSSGSTKIHLFENIYFEEEIEEEIEENILEEEIREEVQEVSNKAEVDIMEEVQEQKCPSSTDNCSYTSFSETDKSERSGQSSGLREAVEEERRAKAALEEALKKEKRAKASLQEALKREERKKKKALEQEQKEKEALAKTLKKEQAEKDSLRIETELMRVRVADLKKSQKEQQHRKAKLKDTITKMSAELNEGKKVIEKLKSDLEVTSSVLTKEIAEHEKVNCAEINALRECLNEQQVQNLEKDHKIESLYFNIQNLQSNIEDKDNIVSSLQEKVDQWASDLKEERTKNSILQTDYEAAVSQQQKEAEKLDILTQENQQLVSGNKRLQDELDTALKQRELYQKQLQENSKACSRFEDAVKKEKAQFSRAYKKIQMQKKELSEKTLALEKSLTTEKNLRSSLKNERMRFEQVVSLKQAATAPQTIPSNQLREVSVLTDRLMYDAQTLRMENADIRAKFKAVETEYDRIKSEYCSLSEGHEEILSKKDEIISENRHTIAKLQSVVDELQAQHSQSKTRQAELEYALKYEKTRHSELQQRVDQIFCAFKKERETCEQHYVELKEALSKKLETLEEKQKLAMALQKAEDNYSRLQRQQLAESESHLRRIRDTELRLNQQKAALDESMKALHHLQQEYIDLGGRHRDINSDYCELLKTHNSLKISYERLCYAQGKPRPEFTPLQFTITRP